LLRGLHFRATSKCVVIRSYSDILIAIRSPPTRQTKFLRRPDNGSLRVAMAEYQLTQRARADLIGIYDFTESKFDSYQADAYYASLIRSFELLADFPLIGQTVEDLAAGYRRFRFQSHLIFYTVQADCIEIRAVIHGAQDIRPQLFD
jgi:toxin ParE1/3/4